MGNVITKFFVGALALLSLGVSCNLVWDGAVQGIGLVLHNILNGGFFLLMGSLSVLFGAAVCDLLVYQVRLHRERQLRIGSFSEFVALLVEENREVQAEHGSLHRVAGAVLEVIPALPSASPQQAQELLRTYYGRLCQHRLIVELYQRARAAYMDESLPQLNKRVDDALSEMLPQPWGLVRLLLGLPLRALDSSWEPSKAITAFDRQKLRTDLSEWGRLVDLHLLADVCLMAKVAQTSPILQASTRKPQKLELPPATEPVSRKPDVALIEQVGDDISTDGVHWEKPEALLKRAEKHAEDFRFSHPELANPLLVDVTRWKAQLERFPHGIFQELIDSEIDADRWPRWFADGLEASIALHGVSASNSTHRRNCIRIFVLGDYEPDEIEPEPGDDESCQGDLTGEFDDQVELRVVTPDPVEDLF